jgi:outer membrane protein TolC
MTMIRSTARTGRAGALVAFLALAVAVPAFAQDTAPLRGTITVDEAVKRALERNHDLLSARENIESAEGRKKQALQRYLPGLDASMNYNKQFDERTQVLVGDSLISVNESYRVSYGVRQTIVDWSAFKSIQAAGNDLSASKYDYAQGRADLVLAAKQQYYALLRAQLLAEVADSALVVSEQELRRVNSLFELGMVARGDVLKAKVRVSQSKLDVITSRNTVVLERSRLSRLIGQDPHDDLAATRDITPTPAEVDSAAVYNEALANRSDLKAAEAALAAANAGVGAAKAGYYPTLDVSLGYLHTDYDPTLSGYRTRSGTLTLNVPIFSSLYGTKGSIQQSQAAANQQRYALDKKKLDVEVEVRESVSTALQANEGLLVAIDQVESAREDLKLSQEKYNVGSGTILDLIDAQVALQRARSNYVNALTLVRVAEAALERVRGRTY